MLRLGSASAHERADSAAGSSPTPAGAAQRMHKHGGMKTRAFNGAESADDLAHAHGSGGRDHYKLVEVEHAPHALLTIPVVHARLTLIDIYDDVELIDF
jgi:hypothetical protein